MFKRKQKPKKLTIHQVHELYLLLRHALPEKEEKYLIDELDAVIDKLNDKTFLQALEIMYAEVSGNPLELFLLFTKGLKENNFFEYANFIKGLKHG